jgi:hypothetical protein
VRAGVLPDLRQTDLGRTCNGKDALGLARIKIEEQEWPDHRNRGGR